MNTLHVALRTAAQFHADHRRCQAEAALPVQQTDGTTLLASPGFDDNTSAIWIEISGEGLWVDVREILCRACSASEKVVPWGGS